MIASFLWWCFGCTAPVTPFCCFLCRSTLCCFLTGMSPVRRCAVPISASRPCSGPPVRRSAVRNLFVSPYSGALPLFGILAVYLSSDGHSVVCAKHICLAPCDYTKHICLCQVSSKEIIKLFCLISSCISEIYPVYYT